MGDMSIPTFTNPRTVPGTTGELLADTASFALPVVGTGAGLLFGSKLGGPAGMLIGGGIGLATGLATGGGLSLIARTPRSTPGENAAAGAGLALGGLGAVTAAALAPPQLKVLLAVGSVIAGTALGAGAMMGVHALGTMEMPKLDPRDAGTGEGFDKLREHKAKRDEDNTQILAPGPAPDHTA